MSEPPTLSSDREWRPAEAAHRKNMLLLVQLRWIAAAGQFGTILTVFFGLGIAIPILPMSGVVAGLVILNLATLILLRRGRPISNAALFAALLVDFVALTLQLYMSGGATNPFAPIGLLQVVIGAVLLETWSCWTLAILHSLAFGALALIHHPLALPAQQAGHPSPAQIFASWINFTLVAVLIMLFATRVSRNLRLRDASLAEMRRREAEEDHIVRMGLLASGAAHELGTPLSSLSVILGDWRKQPAFLKNPALRAEIGEMQAAVARCKQIISGILYASGEARSEAPRRMALRAFLSGIVERWQAQQPGRLAFHDRLSADPPILADQTLAQIIGNVLDNAAEAGATQIHLSTEILDRVLVLIVRDNGPGFPLRILETIGTPYRSTKDRRGGLGLFLAFTVTRKLGGSVEVRNGKLEGAVVTMRIPLDALSLAGTDA
jgi:two-component system, sensor histidine kinase RegB